MARFSFGCAWAFVALVLLAAAACSSSGSHSTGSTAPTSSQGAATYSRVCSQAVGGVLPAAWRESSVVVGSLALYSFGAVADGGGTSSLPARVFMPLRSVKMLALVRPGAAVSLIVPSSERRAVSLAYRPNVLPSTVASGDAVVTFHACPSSSGAGSGVSGWTQFNGGIVVAGARCATFIVRSQSETTRLGLAFGCRRCA